MFKDRLNADLKVAMLSRDTLRTQTLQGLKSAILYEEVAQNIRDTGLDDSAIQGLVVREIKKRDEAAELFERGGNQASADKERAEKEILKVYLPVQLSDEELSAIVDDTISELHATSQQDMGRVIGAVKAKVGNSASGAKVAQMVKAALTT